MWKSLFVRERPCSCHCSTMYSRKRYRNLTRFLAYVLLFCKAWFKQGSFNFTMWAGWSGGAAPPTPLFPDFQLSSAFEPCLRMGFSSV